MQRDTFVEGEGQAWLSRNLHDLGKRDPVMEAMERWNLAPQSILEIGCSNGWRVERLIERYNCKVKGIDPVVPRMPHPTTFTNLHHGHAAALFHYGNAEFDTVIYGFCLYLCDPQDYPSIVKECDRVLADGGDIIIHDFVVTNIGDPWRTPYKHKDGVFSHHVQFQRLWTGFPQYTQVAWSTPDKEFGDYVVLLHKDLNGAFIDKPNP